jgi:hypothetical protein
VQPDCGANVPGLTASYEKQESHISAHAEIGLERCCRACTHDSYCEIPVRPTNLQEVAMYEIALRC